jgi:hypothetical protein
MGMMATDKAVKQAGAKPLSPDPSTQRHNTFGVSKHELLTSEEDRRSFKTDLVTGDGAGAWPRKAVFVLYF